MTLRPLLPWRVIFDTSTLVSAALRPDSIPARALAQAMNFCEVCASRETLGEVQEVLSREKFDRYLAQAERERFLRVLESSVRIFIVRAGDAVRTEPVCRDAKDQKFLELAIESNADTIVSSDEDLIVLDPWNDVRILRPTVFLEMMGSRI